jgi:hypothetical protein
MSQTNSLEFLKFEFRICFELVRDGRFARHSNFEFIYSGGMHDQGRTETHGGNPEVPRPLQ